MLKKIILSLLLINSFFVAVEAQTPSSSVDIYNALKKLNVLGSALYVGAHPDDENTALISYLANDQQVQTAYISLTRGDGGQNLIGSELRELLGVIRTQELLQARKVDGGMQYFSRANDFGFSKNPGETFDFWEKEKVLHDLVYVIRKFKPDVIINRFDHRTPGATHGHHTASAILSEEAFALTGDSSIFAEQLNRVSVWLPKRLFFNDSWFLYPSKEAFEKADHDSKLKIHTGTYYANRGVSNGEISAKSRSQHSSQGFGAAAQRGESTEYLELIHGDMPNKNLFEGIDITWNRVKGGREIGAILRRTVEEFDFTNPAASLGDLLKAYALIQNLEDEHWRAIKTEEIEKIITDVMGLHLEATTKQAFGVRNEDISIAIKAINRSEAPIELKGFSINDLHFEQNKTLEFNSLKTIEQNYTIPENSVYSSPYWLEEAHSTGMYTVSDKSKIGQAESQNPISVSFHLTIKDQDFTFQRDLQYAYVDPARGEIYQPFAILPKATVRFEESVAIYPTAESKKIALKVEAHTEKVSGNLVLEAPADWKISPQEIAVELDRKGESKTYYFEVTAPDHPSEIDLKARLISGDETFDTQLTRIDYSHIPTQYVLLPSQARHVRIDIEKRGNKIAYIQGAGDVVDESLKQIGYEVDVLSVEDIKEGSLASYDAVLLGVRTFNVLPELQYKNKELFAYVKNGGNVIVQYNVSRGQLVTEDVAPYPLRVSVDRVTEEDAEVEFLAPEHPALNFPNKISETDFDHWVQERGLYFPDTWDAHFTPILSMHDKGEDPKEGSLLVAKYGKGYYVYTGLSFFRELPAGVSGAYRLMANLISLGKDEDKK